MSIAQSAERKAKSSKSIEYLKMVGRNSMIKFRFEDLEIWKMAIDSADKLFDIADQLEKKHLFRFAEQLRGSGLSISNNIAEGSGSDSKKDFSKYLNISRRSVYECANILFVLYKRHLLDPQELETLLDELDHLSRKITNFQKSQWNEKNENI